MTYYYQGTIPASKSLMNRALICSTYSAHLKLEGASSCDDILKMQSAVQQLNQNKDTEFDCGAAGTVLRFLSLRLSRIPGKHVLRGTERLMQRPQKDLLDLFDRLGVEYKMTSGHMILSSQGWKNIDKPLSVHRSVSSQFASGLVLNAWNLEQDLVLNLLGDSISEGYLEMTLRVCEDLGMKIERSLTPQGTQLVIKAHSQISKSTYKIESDLSSAFAVAAFAGLNGKVIFQNFPFQSLQPDIEFVEILKQMNFKMTLNEQELEIEGSKSFKGIEVDLASCPDLFPVLAVLCAFADSSSRLYGAPQLIYKESNRIAKVSELLRAIGVDHEVKTDGMIIHPHHSNLSQVTPFVFDTDHDHRLAFAAALVKSRALPIKILHPEVVTKSFPEFWQVVGLENVMNGNI